MIPAVVAKLMTAGVEPLPDTRIFGFVVDERLPGGKERNPDLRMVKQDGLEHVQPGYQQAIVVGEGEARQPITAAVDHGRRPCRRARRRRGRERSQRAARCHRASRNRGASGRTCADSTLRGIGASCSSEQTAGEDEEAERHEVKGQKDGSSAPVTSRGC